KVKKIKFGPEIFYGDNPDAVPYVQLSPLDDEIVASYTGPDAGLAFAEGHSENNYYANYVAGVRDWNLREQQAYGICISLYEQHPISGKISGMRTNRRQLCLMCQRNNTILMVADGVNWGEKSRLAARCALYGSMKYLNYKIFERKHKPENTQDVVRLLRKALDEAHRAIMAKEGGLTTLCLCMVCPVDNSDQHAVCCVNVGDSFGFIYSNNQGIREVTVGSHDVGSERDIRDAGGALGPVDGTNPELHNLTCSVTFCHQGDIVFLTTDGISDNFDPVVTKIALPMRPNDSNFNTREKHVYALKEMERVVHEYELVTEEVCSAQSFCSALLQHVLTITDQKRKIVENPAIYAKRKMTKKDRQTRDSEIVEKMSKAPGKLDHASIVAVEVGAFARPSNDGSLKLKIPNVNGVSSPITVRAVSQPRNIPETPPTPTNLPLCGSVPLSPPSHSSKKSGARKFFAKLRSLPSSPTSVNPQPLSSSVPNAPFRSLSPPPIHTTLPQRPLSPPVSNSTPTSPARLQTRSSSSDTRKGLDLQFSPRKFPKKHRRAKTAELHTPSSPTIAESPELDGSNQPLSSASRSRL
ncbi:unnamed protein product, partial [Candidula unifasciata]